MNLRIILVSLALSIFVSAFAQSPAAQVKEIQKDHVNFINAESTDPDEEEAYNNALRQMIDMARNFVSTNNDGADISDAAIESAIQKIVIPRGEFKRVFLYAKRSDLLNNSGTNESSVITSTVEQSLFETIEETPSEQDSSDNFEGFVDSEEFEAGLSEEVVDDVKKSASIPAGVQELIDLLQNSRSLGEASRILEKYKNRGIVSDYGVAKQCRNSAVSYWVVENNGQITVLGPEIRGHRNNFRTGKTDALHRYRTGVWFRKR